jgi:hypothetical protein
MKCCHCTSARVVKNGRSRHGHQRWLCRDCHRTCGERDRRRVPPDQRAAALNHYLEGVGLRATERLVGVSHNAVMNWVLEAVADKVLAQVPPGTVEWVEADELWTYVGKKNKRVGYGGLLIVIPSRSAAGRWGIVAPKRPSGWMRNFLMPRISLSAPTFGIPTVKSSAATGICKAKPTPSPSRA